MNGTHSAYRSHKPYKPYWGGANEQKIFSEKRRRRAGQHQRRDDVSIVSDARVGADERNRAQEDFGRYLSTRRDGRFERGHPIRRAGVLQSAVGDRDPASRGWRRRQRAEPGAGD